MCYNKLNWQRARCYRRSLGRRWHDVCGGKEESFLHDVTLPDASSVGIVVICTDGRMLRKVGKDDSLIKVYPTEMPCFAKNQKNS